ncbi:MAG: NAD(+) synthase, partial [Duncaniella sp.]|nr:NAD(+) synthase [Duncaniella sp.]
MRDGFLRVAACAPRVRVADVDYNLAGIIGMLDRLEADKVELAVFPEMSLTGYTCADLFHSRTLIDAAYDALLELAEYSREHVIHFVVGLPVVHAGAMYNCAALLRGGDIRLVAKSYIPNYNEFYERRWWRPLAADTTLEVNISGVKCPLSGNTVYRSHGAVVGIEICEDLWVPVPPSCRQAMAGAQVVLNLSASDDLIGKYDYLRRLIAQQSARCLCAYAYAGAGWG